ncbi:hypothetical protein GCM10027053_45080 [Intrasporangium mesophilum]
MGVLVPGTATWADTVPVVFAAALLLFAPGAVGLLLLRLRPLAALALAPVVSTALVAGTGVLLPFLHTRWGLVPLVVATVGLWAVCAVVGAVLPPDRRGPVVGAPGWAVLAGVGLALLVVLASVLPVQSSPEAFSQQPDTVFHLADIQWMLREGTISSLQAGKYQTPDWSGFYPSAFHGLTATVTLLTGASVPVSASGVVLVIVGLVWPLGCIALSFTVLGLRPGVALATGLTSVAFGAFPYLLMGYGVLWPAVLGQALVPASLAAFVALVGVQSAPPYAVAGRWRAALLVLVAVLALATAHPNALIVFGLFAALVVGGRVVRSAWSLRVHRPWLAVGMVAGFGLAVVLALLASRALRSQSMFEVGRFGPGRSAPQVWEYVLLFAADGVQVLPVLTALAVVGCVVLVKLHPGARWCVAALVLSLVLLWLNIAVDNGLVRALTWPWYNDTPRIETIVILPAVVASSAALVWLGDLVSGLLARRVRSVVTRREAAAVGAVAVLGATTILYVGAHQEVLRPYFHPSADRSWVTDDELVALRELSASLPPDAVVAANPWNGATYLYVVSGRRLLVPTEKTNYPGDISLLSLRLDAVGADPEVCAAAQRHQVDWAVTGGEAAHPVLKVTLDEYRGVDAVDRSPAWQKVRSAGPYTLYRRISCAE